MFKYFCILLLTILPLHAQYELFTAIIEKNDYKIKHVLKDKDVNINQKLNRTQCRELSKNEKLDKKTKSFLQYDYNVTPLILAAKLDYEYGVRSLLKKESIIKYTTTKKGKVSAIWYAAKNNHNNNTQLLMGIDPLDKKHEVNKYLVNVYLNSQEATITYEGNIIQRTKISSGKSSTPTPTGTYIIVEKDRHHVSNLYHVKMPYFQRFDVTAFGLHSGRVPNYPASHGCVRLPYANAKKFFVCPRGTKVVVSHY
jgi:hypothetical protein